MHTFMEYYHVSMNSVAVLAWLLTVLGSLQLGSANADILDELPSGCDVALSEMLRDDLFSASSNFDQDSQPHHAKRGGAGWMSRALDWYDSREETLGNEYLQLDFDRTVEITGLRLDKGKHNCRSKSVRVSYSDDGLVWKGYNNKHSTDLDPHPVGDTLSENNHGRVEVLFDPHITARFIAINPKTYYDMPCMTIEVFGCDVTTGPQVPSPTYITSNIYENTTWTASQSPIVINRSIEVAAGARLVVEDGVTVVFTTEQSGLNVGGDLEARGASLSGVLFTSNYPALVTARQWAGIKQLSHDNQVDGLINMQYTTIRQAKVGLLGLGDGVKMGFSLVHSCEHGLKLSTGTKRQPAINADVIDDQMLQSAQIFNSKFMYNRDGIKLYGQAYTPFFLLYKCELSYNRVGLRVKDWDGEYTGGIYIQLMLVEGDVSRNKLGLLIDREVYATVLLLNSKLANNSDVALGDTMLYVSSTAYDLDLTIEDCSFIDNKQALYFHFAKGGNDNYTIQDNYFRNSSLQLIAAKGANIEFLRNELEYNSPLVLNVRYPNSLNIHENAFTYVPGPVQLDVEISGGVAVNITKNTMTHVYGKNAIAIRSIFNKIYIGHNTFYNATVENIIYAQNSIVTLERNNFSSSNFHPKCLIKLGNIPVSPVKYRPTANLNYWGTADISDIKTRICDFFLNSKVNRIRINNIFNTPNMTSLINTIKADGFSYAFDDELGATVIGGEISTDLSDLTFEGPVILNRSLFITETGSFSFSGMTVNITENRGIYVQGNFSIGSNSKKRTVLRSHVNGTSWNGIQMRTPEISMINAEISDFVKLFDFADMDANFENSEIYNGGAVFADETNGKYFNVKITSCTIDVKLNVIDVIYSGYKDTNIALINSTLHSEKGNIIKIQELWSAPTTTLNLQIINSNLSAYFAIANVRMCAGAITGRVEKSQFLTREYGLKITGREYDFIIHDNEFYNYSYAAYEVFFCDRYDPPTPTVSGVASRQIDIARNVFTSSRESATIINIDMGYTKTNISAQYVVSIHDNVFDDKSRKGQTAISIYPSSNLDMPLTNDTFYISKNVFKQVKKTGVLLSSGNNKLFIENNTFEDGARFIDADLVDDKSTQLLVKGNTVSGCSADGIVNLKQPAASSTAVSLTNNWFVNNSQVVISLTSPYLQILNNFFENSNATYNLKVVKTSTSYTKMAVDASRNYWGTNEAGAIGYTIYDHDADVELFDVNVMPFLASKNTSDVVSDVGSFHINHSLLIEGELSGNVILAPRKDPYRIENDIRIMTTGRLTIEPGVRIEFGPSKSIVILGEGQLVAKGTQNAPIVMTIAETSHQWKGLKIPSGSASYLRHVILNNTMEGLLVQSIHTHLQNVTVENSLSDGIHIAIKSGSAKEIPRPRVKRETKNHVLAYSDLRAINNEGNGIYLSDAYASNITLALYRCIATGNLDHGVIVRADTNVEVKDCEISNNLKGGMSVSQIFGTTAVRSSRFIHNNGTTVSISDTECFTLDSSLIRISGHDMNHEMIRYSSSLKTNEGRFLTICNNRFLYNSLTGILIHLYYAITVHVNICDNTFRGKNTVLRVQTFTDYIGVTKLNITGNDVMDLLSEQRSVYKHAILSFDGSFPNSNLTVKKNSFHWSESTACVFITGANNANNFRVLVEDNDFVMTTRMSAYIDIESYPTMVLRNNRFYGSARNQCFLKAPTILESGFHLTATHNYWGTSSEQDLMEKVCGFDRDMSRSRVDYMPFYLDDGLRNLEEAPGDFNILQAGTTNSVSTVRVIGGEVTGDIVLSKSGTDGRYVISRSIWVRKGAVLTIEQGVTLEFESGRGIYVDGQLNVFGKDKPVLFTNRTSPWYGLVLSSQSGKPADTNMTTAIEHAIVENAEFGIVAHTDDFTTEKTTIRNVDNSCFIVSALASGNFYLNHMLLQNCSKTGLEIRSYGEVMVSYVFIENTNVGVNATVYAGALNLEGMFIKAVETTAIAVTLEPGGEIEAVSVEQCAITDTEKGIGITVNEKQSFSEIQINGNTFNNVKQAFEISDSENGDTNSREITMWQNNFINVCSVVLTSRASELVKFHENDIYKSQCPDNADGALLKAVKKGPGVGKISISYNVFRQIEKTYVANLQESGVGLYTSGRLNHNSFLGCQATRAVVLLEAEHYSVRNNVFESPASPYDIFVDKHGNGTIMADGNYFDGKNNKEASERVYDKSQDPNLLALRIHNVSVSKPSGCKENGNCNAHGTCVFVRLCVCHPGWSDNSCERFHCRGAHNCYGNGKCVGPNQCKCSDEWGGELCNMYIGTSDGLRPWIVVVIALVACLLLVTAIVAVCIYLQRRRRRRDTAYNVTSSKDQVSMSLESDTKPSQI